MQAPGHQGDDGILGPVGQASVVAADRPGIPDQLGMRLSFGGVVRAVGLGAAEAGKLEGVESIGVDEIHWGKSKRADNFLTVIYQIDSHCRRLLWVGKRRSKATLRRG